LFLSLEKAQKFIQVRQELSLANSDLKRRKALPTKTWKTFFWAKALEASQVGTIKALVTTKCIYRRTKRKGNQTITTHVAESFLSDVVIHFVEETD
jgi:hypothetical protein